MAYLHRIIFFCLLAVPALAQAATYDAVDYRAFAQDSNGNWKTIRGSGGNFTIQSGNGGNTVTQTGKLPIPASNGKSYPVSVPRTAAVDMLKVGGALANMAKKLSPAGMAIGTVAYICTETNICDIDGLWQKAGDSDLTGFPPTTGEIAYYCTGFGCTPTGVDIKSPTPTTACTSVAGVQSETFYYKSNTTTQCTLGRVSGGADLVININRFGGACPANYISNGTECVLQGSADPTPATETDWDNAADQLNQPASTDHIINNGGDVPVDVSTPPTIDNAPINQPIGSTTSTNYDNLGNATGTTVTESTLHITDGATAQAPNSITFNETTIINNYDLNNNLVDSTTTTIDTPPPEPPEIGDIEIEFDSVPEHDLEEYEIPEMEQWSSWGSGSCPAPLSVVTSVWTGEIDTAPLCDFATAINPFVLLFGALVSAYIVAGVRSAG